MAPAEPPPKAAPSLVPFAVIWLTASLCPASFLHYTSSSPPIHSTHNSNIYIKVMPPVGTHCEKPLAGSPVSARLILTLLHKALKDLAIILLYSYSSHCCHKHSKHPPATSQPGSLLMSLQTQPCFSSSTYRLMQPLAWRISLTIHALSISLDLAQNLPWEASSPIAGSNFTLD